MMYVDDQLKIYINQNFRVLSLAWLLTSLACPR